MSIGRRVVWLTFGAVVETKLNDGLSVGAGGAGLNGTVANTVAKIFVFAEAEHVRLVVLIWAAEVSSFSEHVVEAFLLRQSVLLQEVVRR
jgi:hypothetical protein